MTEQQKALQALLEQLQETKADPERCKTLVDNARQVKEAEFVNKYRMFPDASEFTVVRLVG